MSDLKRILSVNYNQVPCYEIIYDSDFSCLDANLSPYVLQKRKICIVTDSNVGTYHSHKLQEALQNVTDQIYVYTFPAGEQNKNLMTVQSLYQFLIDHSFDRNDVLFALGGGVVGDLTGFTAATYLRGIRFFQVPTSLLAMVDSSIGGKTGVDFDAYKNMVGAFYMPQGVYMNLSTLLTLPQREYLSGMGEVIKHGLIKDCSYYDWLKKHKDEICSYDMESVLTMVYQSCEIKKEVVERDPKELGERALLNFGHSIGHAVEKLLDFRLLHGECVSIGMVAACYLSHLRGYISEAELNDIIQTLESYQLPVQVEELDVSQVLNAMSKDKKMDAGVIKFILINGIGNGVIDTTVTKEELIQAIKFIVSKNS